MTMAGEDHQRLQPRPLLVAGALAIANLFLHKPISDVLDALYSRVGRNRYETIGLVGIGALCAVAALPSMRRLRATLPQTWLPLSLTGLAALTVATQRWLLVTNIELIHFPQFALMSVLFLAAGVAPKWAWVLGSLAGALDESYQHLVIYADVAGTYFDINDILLNAIGAAWGVCLFGAARLAQDGPLHDRRAATWATAALAVVVLAAFFLDPPDTTLLRPAATLRLYRVLSIGEGLIGIAAVAAMVELSSHPRRAPRGNAGPSTE